MRENIERLKNWHALPFQRFSNNLENCLLCFLVFCAPYADGRRVLLYLSKACREASLSLSIYSKTDLFVQIPENARIYGLRAASSHYLLKLWSNKCSIDFRLCTSAVTESLRSIQKQVWLRFFFQFVSLFALWMELRYCTSIWPWNKLVKRCRFFVICVTIKLGPLQFAVESAKICLFFHFIKRYGDWNREKNLMTFNRKNFYKKERLKLIE